MPNFFLSHKRVKVAGRMASRFHRKGRPPPYRFAATAPRSGPRTAGFTSEVAAGTKSENAFAVGRYRSTWAMKLLTGLVVSVGLVFTAVAANAQGLPRYEVGDSPYIRASDIDGPYAAMPPEAPLPRYHPGYGPPSLLPATEVYTVLRESGFSPLGIPRRRGLVYTISVIDRAGDDGRLLIDARTGRIIRFIRASRIGGRFDDGLTETYGPARPLPP